MIEKAKGDAMAREGSYVPQTLQASSTSQLLYEPVDEVSQEPPLDDLAQWMNTALDRADAARLLAG